jgi:uncharacterized repeat protein (TIGR01451 family)
MIFCHLPDSHFCGIIVNHSMTLMRIYFTTLALSLCLHFQLGAQNASTYSAHVPVRYFETGLTLIKTTPGFSPPVASRALGYMGLTAYEAAVPGISGNISSDGVLPNLGPGAITDPIGAIHYPTAVNNALSAVMDSLFQNMTAANRTALYALRDSINALYAANPNYTASKAWGESVGADIFAYSRTDGAHQGYLSNTPASYLPVPAGFGLWVPTPPAFQAIPVQPYWGNNRTFDADANGSLVPGPHLFFDTLPGSSFYQFVQEVVTTKQNLTPEQTNIALYWADGGGSVTPPGHSISILTQLIKSNNENLAFAVEAYAKMGMSVSDAFVNCWKTKYAYNLMRPITYIRQYIDPTWTSLIATPPFPEYTSGHSTQSGAFSAVMAGLYGPNLTFTDNTHGASFGGPRTFNSFDEAANEAAVSRLYGGIHYSFSNELGITVGKAVGSSINGIFATQLRTLPVADAAVQITANLSTAQIGDTITYTVSLLNQGLTALHGVTVRDTLPSASLQFVSAETFNGTYDPLTGIWALDSVAAGVPQVTLTLKAIVTAEGVPYHVAELMTLTETDGDSAPGNGILTEDDIASICVSVPMVLCNPNLTLTAPAGFTAYQWYQSLDMGATYTAIGTTASITVTQGGFYKFTVDGGTLGTCGNQLCCPLIVEEECCPINICLPIMATRN